MSRMNAGDDDDLASVGGERLISRRHMLAGMAPRANIGSTASAAAQPASAAAAASSSPHGMSRRPSVLSLALSASERFKKDESAFLSKGSPSSASAGSGTGPGSPQWRARERGEREELDRFLDSMLPAGARSSAAEVPDAPPPLSSPSSLSLHQLDAVNEQSAALSPQQPPRSPAPHSTTLSPNAGRSHTHARRPSYMQATQQELKRQAELREAALARERRVEEEKTKSTRRGQGVSASDIYQRQQQELEQRRLAAIEKEEAERRLERNKLAAKFDAQLANLLGPAPAPAPAATARKPAASSFASAAHTAQGGQASYASGSQTSRAAGVGAGANAANAGADEGDAEPSSALQLQLELSRLEGVIRRDAQGPAAGHRANASGHSSSSSDDDDDASSSSDEDEESAADGLASALEKQQHSELASPRHGRRKGIPSGVSAASATSASTAGGRTSRFHAPSAAAGLDLSPSGQARSLGHPAVSTGTGASSAFPAALSPMGGASANSALSAALHSPLPGDTVERGKHSRAVASVADIYDPALLRRAGESNQPYGTAPSVTGLDFLMESIKFRDKQKRKQLKKGGAGGGTGGGAGGGAGGAASNPGGGGFGRMTAAQLERSLDQLAKKKMLDQKAADTKSNHAHAVQVAQAAQAAKRPFFPTLWRKITGSSAVE